MIGLRGKRGIAPILIALSVIGVVLLFYIILYLPFPSFKALRYSINYWGLLLIFFSVQAGIIYLYYKGISLFTKGFNDIKRSVIGYTDKFKKFIHFNFRV